MASPRPGHGQRFPSGTSPGPASPATSAPVSLPQTLWSLEVPLQISHPSLPAHPPFVVSVPRFSYLSQLLPRLTAYFGGATTTSSSFHHEEVQLRNLPVGLLLDLYQPAALPWRLALGSGPAWDTGDTFLNAAKEADFVRNGNAKMVMGLSKADTQALWNAVVDNDYAAFARINTRLLNPPSPLRSVPLRIYIPTSPPAATSAGNDQGSYRVMQTPIPPRTPSRSQHTLGSALRTLVPALFPSSRDPVLAQAVMHGAPVPLAAPLEDLMREAAYPDGWLCLIVVLL